MNKEKFEKEILEVLKNNGLPHENVRELRISMSAHSPCCVETKITFNNN